MEKARSHGERAFLVTIRFQNAVIVPEPLTVVGGVPCLGPLMQAEEIGPQGSEADKEQGVPNGTP